jgi:Flp pilus assembly CpaF family ATPase
MFGIFQLSEEINKPDLKKFMREHITSALNKGVIIPWTELSQILPEEEDLISAKYYYETLISEDTFKKLFQTKSFSEFYFHGPGKVRYLNTQGQKETTSFEIDEDSWQLWLEIIAIKYKQNWNCQTPFVSFRAEINGHPYRFSLLHHQATSSSYSTLIVRNLQLTTLPLNAFGEVPHLEKLIEQKKNVLICGGTGSGKTSLINSLLTHCPEEEHLVVLEDTQEIILPHAFCTRFLAHEHPSYSLEHFLTYSLRLSPDRIVLGEIRSKEVVSYLLAMNTGHRGVLTTIHSNSALEGLHRLQMLFGLYGKGMEIGQTMNLICQNIDCIIFIENKQIKEIIKPLGQENGFPFYETLFQA